MDNSERFSDEKLSLDNPSPTGTGVSGDAVIPMPNNASAPLTRSPRKSWFSWRPKSRLTDEEEFRLHGTIVQELETYPEGYPRLAAFQASDDCFSLYRGFGYLHSRIILGLQAEIAVLEEDLRAIDVHDWQQDDRRQCLKSRGKDLADAEEEGYEGSRPELLEKLRTKLIEYDDMLIRARDLNTFQRPAKRDYHSLRSWHYTNAPLLDSEADCVRHKEDMVTLRHGREWSEFDGLIETVLRKIDCRLVRRLFCSPELRRKTVDKNAHYYSAKRIETFVALLITCVIFALLVLPVVAMYKLTCIGSRNATFDAVAVLIVFTLLFASAMSLLTKARRHELFGASAAYCAVLVVFITNFNNVGQVSFSPR